jgi:tyrosyl-tRNA synthetase
VDVITREELEKMLNSKKKLRIKLGIDPTGSNLHLGHMVQVRKLSEFQKLGHHILLLFGNFTGQIGDPKAEVRQRKTQQELEKNAETYVEQVQKIIDINNIEVVWNADWLGKLNFADVVDLASNFTVSQMIERDLFQARIKKKQPVYVHEFMYPLMQGYDSVALKSDVEIGGTDQTFNLLAGRSLQKAYGQKPQSIITNPILEGIDGYIKMGKSEGNFIGVTEEPNIQYGKIMSIPDHLILRYFELATNLMLNEIDQIRNNLAEGINPRDVKMKLAREIVSIYYSETEAQEAENYFKNVFQKNETPEDIPSYKCQNHDKLIDILVNAKLSPSKAEARRLITQNAVSFDDQKITDINYEINKSGIIKAGKRRFLRVVL